MIDSKIRDYELLKADLKAEIIKELTKQDIRVAQDITKTLAQVWNKYKKPLYEKFGVVTYHQVWECVRKVRDLLPSEEESAAEIAEMILNQMGVEPDDMEE